MSPVAIEIIIILLLLAANGLFAMTEIAVVSARKTRCGVWRKPAT